MQDARLYPHVLRFSRARLRAAEAGMSSDRLKEETRQLYDALNAIWQHEATRAINGWRQQATRVILAVSLATLVFGGTTLGTLIGTRRALFQTAAIIKSQQDQIEVNARLIHAQREKDRIAGDDRRRLIELLSKAAKNVRPTEKSR